MDAFDFSDVKAEKRSAMSTYNLFSSITKTLRVFELCLVLLFFSWILTRLPFALRVSADFLRSPLFVFAIFNAIIAALLAQSGRRFSATTDGGTTETDHISISSQPEPDSGAPVAEQVEFQDKQVSDTCKDEVDSGAVTDFAMRKVCRRSQSDTMKGEDGKRTARGKFHRSKMENGRKNFYAHDKLSNEEFQRTIEAFIAKQMRMLREESCYC